MTISHASQFILSSLNCRAWIKAIQLSKFLLFEKKMDPERGCKFATAAVQLGEKFQKKFNFLK